MALKLLTDPAILAINPAGWAVWSASHSLR